MSLIETTAPSDTTTLTPSLLSVPSVYDTVVSEVVVIESALTMTVPSASLLSDAVAAITNAELSAVNLLAPIV